MDPPNVPARSELELEVRIEPRFPVEIWCLIFRNLRPLHLQRARLVCQLWNRIISSSSALMDKLIFQFPPDTLQERNSEGFQVLSTSKTRFTRMIFDLQSCDILETTSLQSLTSITELVILKCTTSTLLGMLRKTVNLRMLKIYDIKNVNLSDLPKIDFELQYLEELTLENHIKLLDVFKGVCPRLKVLGVFGDLDDEKFHHDLFEFVCTVQGTLEEIRTRGVNANFWKDVANIDRLRLIRAPDLDLHGSELIRFTEKQTAIEEISIKYQSREVGFSLYFKTIFIAFFILDASRYLQKFTTAENANLARP